MELGFLKLDSVHKFGIIEFNVSQLSLTQYIICTSQTPNTAIINVTGGYWQGRGYFAAQTNGFIDFQISNSHLFVQNGGIYEIFNNEMAAWCNGSISFHGSKIINVATSQTGNQIVSCIYCPQPTLQRVSILNCFLACRVNVTDSSLSIIK